jgi:TonB family protein
MRSQAPLQARCSGMSATSGRSPAAVGARHAKVRPRLSRCAFQFACALTLAAKPAAAFAQVPTDSARCRAMLAHPTHDSVTVDIGVSIAAFDTAINLSSSFRGLIAQGLRATLHPPRPLALDVYTVTDPAGAQGTVSGDGVVTPTLTGAYRAALMRDGSLRHIRVVGGAGVRTFDRAFLVALQKVSDSGYVMPIQDGTRPPPDSVELRFVVQPSQVSRIGVPSPGDSGTTLEPLLRLRVPALGSATNASPVRDNPSPRYPANARSAGVEGKTVFQFVIDERGMPDMASVQILQATATPFASAVLDVLPRFRFFPLRVNGCPLASLVQMPFTFALTP